MAKTITKRILPVFLIILLAFTLMPITAMAQSPDITIEPGGGVGDTSITPGTPGSDITIEPTAPGSSTPPDTSQPPENGPGDEPATPAPQPDAPDTEDAAGPEDGDQEDAAGSAGGLDGAGVIIEGSSMARGFSTMATGTLSIHKYEQYQWDFSKGHGVAEMRPWYIMTIDGRLAYCVEPLNPETNSGGYTTIDYNALNVSQQYAIGYAMLYGAQDMSDPLHHMATQLVIWQIALGEMELENFTMVSNASYGATIGHNPGAAGYYDTIVAAMRAHTEIPSFTHFYIGSAPVHQVPGVNGEYKVDLVNTNPNATLADFNFANTGTVSFVREGETMHVTSTGPLSSDTLYSAYKGSVGHTNSLVFWGSGGDQIRATAGILDPVPAHFRLETQNIGEYIITIEKLQDGTNIPLSGAEFHVRHTEKGDIGTFTTDGSGKVVVPVPWQGTYVVTETVPPDNHLLDDNNVKYAVISTERPHATLTYHNKAFSGLQITKIDSVTREPVGGVVFRIAWEGGFRSMTVTTNAAGIAQLADLEPGFYEVTEISCPPGYILNDTPQTIEIRHGETAKVIFENTPLPGLAILKIDSVTGLGMMGVEFEVEKISGERIGTYVSDEGGYIFIPDITEEQYVVVRETKTLPGYRIDTAEKLVKLEYGKLNKVVFENSPWPYLVIVKIDEGTKEPIPGTVFKLTGPDGKDVGTYTTNVQGRVVLTGIDAGLYVVQEIEAAPGYVLDDREFEVELKWGCTTTFTLKNTPLDIDVTVEKRGVVECFAGDEIRYDFRNIANNSSVPLDDFYWHDLLPTDAVRLESIHTGTWNEVLTYRMVYRTNLKDNWTVLADNLSTKVNHQLDTSAQVLGLAANEYLTEYKFEFGTVKSGFREVEAPFIMCRVLADLPDQYQFINRTDVGGRYGGKWTYDKDSWVSIVYITEKGKLPKTGVYL